jgi:bifunctional non-homologous end joining protein LigD
MRAKAHADPVANGSEVEHQPEAPERLEKYRSKRHFSQTPEPSGTRQPHRPDDVLRFVVQKHDASRLHYDFRLELGGVLLSWAVPKGPSLDPRDKRLAMHVEDHPLDYASFEGIIPQGEYGAGTVIVWDEGWWEPIEDSQSPAEGLDQGALKFRLHGQKLQGGWALVRLKPREGDHGESWLLIKERDEAARPRESYDVLKERPESVISGRTIDQVADEEGGPGGSTYHSNRAAGRRRRAGHPTANDNQSQTANAPARATLPAGDDPFPADASMQLATLATRPPEGDGWIHELKYDGYRIRAMLSEGHAHLLTRNDLDWTGTFPAIEAAVASLPVSSAVLDGEVVAFDAHGGSDFGSLQDAIAKKRTDRLAYVVFDLLYLDGHDLRQQPLVQRKELLRALLETSPEKGVLRYADDVSGHGPEFHDAACSRGLEGSVSKRADSAYVGGRSRDWVKVRCGRQQEFVIGGYTDPAGNRKGFGALLLGAYAALGELRFAGRVGTGFDERVLAELRVRLDALETDEPAFMNPPRQDGKTHWVQPRLVAEVAFKEWTRDGIIRQPSFKGLREDKAAEDVTFEVPEAAPSARQPGGARSSRQTRDSSAAAVPTPSAAGSSRKGAFGRDVTVAGVRITNPEKLLFEDSPLTKIGLVYYYERVAPYILPHVAKRPLTFVRCPIGEGKGCFYQKHPDMGIPNTLETIEIQEREGPALYMWLDDVPGLLSLAQLGVLEIHTWGSRVASPYKPDRIIFDLDPGPGVVWDEIVDAAMRVKERLESLGFTPFVKTTGGKGLHVVFPVEPSLTYDEVRPWTKSIVDSLVAERPESLVGKMTKSIRAGKIFIDYVRNAQGATAVAPYSTRARAGAPIAVPVEWDELLKKGFDPKSFTAEKVLQRLAEIGADPWADIDEAQASARTLRAAASARS